MSGSRTYKDAIDCLNSLQSNAATIDAIRAQGIAYDHIIPESLDYLKRVGYVPQDLNALNVIHITGTKGKGSTSAFCNSILTKLAPSAKIGLYTSPHLVAVRERIRINGEPLAEDKFAKYFFEVWDRFEQNKPNVHYKSTTEKPAYFRYLTTMAYHVFLQEKVDATILEVGIGGTYDSTNLVLKPLSTGVTALGLDHIFVLGKTLEEIAHQKAGIYKAGVPALTVDQPPNGLQVLRLRAAELGASSFNIVSDLPQIKDIKLGLAGGHQHSNASLAVALVQTFLASPALPAAFREHAIKGTTAVPSEEEQALSLVHLDPALLSPSPLPEAVVEGLKNARWPGRCQVVEDQDQDRKGVRWLLDGAHTVESLLCCGEWFVEEIQQSPKRQRILIFNCTSGRSAESLLESLTDAMSDKQAKFSGQSVGDFFSHVIFCTNATYADGASKGDLTSALQSRDNESLAVQHDLAKAWAKLADRADSTVSKSAQVHVLPSIQHAVELVAKVNNEGQDRETDVLVTGSLHLIGGVFEVAGLKYAL